MVIQNQKLNRVSSDIQKKMQDQSTPDKAQTVAIVRDELMKNYKSGTPIIPPHKHNGTDNLRINGRDIIWNKKFATGVTADESGGGGQATYSGIMNPSSIMFCGIARNPVTGTATIKASIVGNAQLGVVKGELTSDGQQLNLVDKGIIQMCTGTLNTLSGTWTPSVFQTAGQLATVNATDQSICSLRVISWTNTSVTFEATVSAGWLLQGNIIIS